MIQRDGQWWHTPLILALGRQRQEDLCEFKVSLVYRVSSRTVSKATQRNPVKGKQTNNKKFKESHFRRTGLVSICARTLLVTGKTPDKHSFREGRSSLVQTLRVESIATKRWQEDREAAGRVAPAVQKEGR